MASFRLGMVLERDLLAVKLQLKHSVKVGSQEVIWNEFGTSLFITNSNLRTLADPGNKGKLDRDEFAVALHLVYPPNFPG